MIMSGHSLLTAQYLGIMYFLVVWTVGVKKGSLLILSQPAGIAN